jgi:DNA-binding response OmpR family regulator
LRILVVEDEPAVRRVLVEYLTVDGHTVEMADNGHAGWEIFLTSRFDLVVTDRALPQMSGDQLAVAIKERSPTTPVILLTGLGDLMITMGEHSAEVDLVLGKPLTANRLRRAIAMVMNLKVDPP